MLSLLNKIWRDWWLVLILFFGLLLLYFGNNRLSMGISAVQRTDAFNAQFMSVGLMYLQIGFFVTIVCLAWLVKRQTQN